MGIEERRRYPRIPIKAEIEYLEFETTDAELLVTASRNISAGGVCIITFKKFALGTVLALRLKLPGVDRGLSVRGRVVWINQLGIEEKKIDTIFEVGIEFSHVEGEDARAIQEYIATQLHPR